MAHSVSVTAALRHQDLEFYSPSFPKEHVEFLMISLERMAECDNMWRWPTDLDYEIKTSIHKLNDKFKKFYTPGEVMSVINKLFARYYVMKWMRKQSSLVWDKIGNTFSGSQQAWEKLVQEDDRCLWYVVVGDPWWSDLGVIFEGAKFGCAEDSEDKKSASHKYNEGWIIEGSTYELDKVLVVDGVPPLSPGSNARAKRAITLPDSPAGWNLGIGSPSRFNPMRFATPAIGSPSVQSIGEDEWQTSKLESERKSAAKKKLNWENTLSPDNSSSASSPIVRDGIYARLMVEPSRRRSSRCSDPCHYQPPPHLCHCLHLFLIFRLVVFFKS